MTLFSLSKSTAETALKLAELVIIASGLLLAFGAIGEYLEEHQKLPRWMAGPKIVFIGIVVASLIGEFLGDAGVFIFSERLKSINDAESKALRERVRAEIDARLALEEEVLEQGPRNLMLSGKRAETLVNSLRQFKGQQIQIRRCVFFDSEVLDTANRLVAIFERAEWRVSPNSPDWGESNCLLPPNSPTESGIWVGTPSAAANNVTQGRVSKVLEFLKKVPLMATVHSVRPDTARAESGKSIEQRYDATDGIVLVVLSHSFERNNPAFHATGGIVP